MSPLLQITAYSLLVGVVAAGFVWYGWALVDNIRVVKQNRVLRAAQADEPDSDETPSTDGKDKS